MAKAVSNLLAPIQTAYQGSKEWQDIALKAYPPPPNLKKEKKVKNKGTRHPGKANNEELPIREAP